MKSRRNVIEFFFLIISAGLVFIACPGKNSTEEKKNIILGFSQIGAESSWRICNTQSVLEEAERAGIQVIFDNAQQKQENQLKAIRSFIVYRVDVIAFVPIVETGWENVLQEAKEAGIPVIVVDREIDCDKSLYTGFLGEDTEEEGRNAARFLLSKFEASTENVNILEIAGTKNSSPTRLRGSGFRQVIGTQDRFSIIHSENADFLRSKGKQVADNFLEKNGGLVFGGRPIHAILSHNDAMTLGILEALEEHGINPGHDVAIVSFDAEQEAIDRLKMGKINCIVECNPKLGYELMKLVRMCAQGYPIPDGTFVKESVFSEKDNFSLIPDRGF